LLDAVQQIPNLRTHLPDVVHGTQTALMQSGSPTNNALHFDTAGVEHLVVYKFSREKLFQINRFSQRKLS